MKIMKKVLMSVVIFIIVVILVLFRYYQNKENDLAIGVFKNPLRYSHVVVYIHKADQTVYVWNNPHHKSIGVTVGNSDILIRPGQEYNNRQFHAIIKAFYAIKVPFQIQK